MSAKPVALTLLAITACASGGHGRDLLDGAPVRSPPATYAPIGSGLPEYFRDPEPPPLLRTEPPFRAARAPQPAPDPVVLGVTVPVPAEEFQRIPVNLCLGFMHAALNADVARRAVASAAAVEKRRCIVFAWLSGCTLELKVMLEEAQSKGGAKFDASAVQALADVHDLARRREQRECRGITGKGGTLTDEEHDAWVQIGRRIAFAMDGTPYQ